MVRLKSNLFRHFSCAISLFWMVASASAQPGSWSALSQIAPGTEVRVSVIGGRTVRGTLQSIGPDSLAVRAGAPETFTRANVRRVDSKRNGHRGRNALIGLGIGAAGGLGIGAGIDAGSHGWFPNFGKAAFTPIGAIVGAIIGVAIPSGGWHEVYRAP